MPNSSPPDTTTASETHVGQVRTANQDVCGEFTDEAGRRLLVVADGMGGHAGGETASRLALETIGRVFAAGFDSPIEGLRKALETANSEIHQLGNDDSRLHNMGTTAVALLLDGSDRISVAHVGDSRAYRLRSGHLEQLTDDHSWVSEEVRRNRIAAEDAESHPMKNVLLRSLGVAPRVEVSVSNHAAQSGDRYLLCSDGLWGEVGSDAIAEILGRCDAATAVRELVDLANRNGGSDNVTVAIAILGGDDSETTLETQAGILAPSGTESVTLPVSVEEAEPAADTGEGTDAPRAAAPPAAPDASGWQQWTGPVIAFFVGLLGILALWASL